MRVSDTSSVFKFASDHSITVGDTRKIIELANLATTLERRAQAANIKVLRERSERAAVECEQFARQLGFETFWSDIRPAFYRKGRPVVLPPIS